MPPRTDIETALDEARDHDAERAVIAACILLGRATTKPALTEGDFTEPTTKTLWKVLRKLTLEKRLIGDATLLIGALKDAGCWGHADEGPEKVSTETIMGLFRLLPHGRAINEYSARVREMTKRRAALARAENELKRARPQ